MSSNSRIYNGTIAGIAGGVGYSIVIMMNNEFPTIAAIVGYDTVLIGVLIHTVLSIFAGIVFAVFYDNLIKSLVSGAVYGMIYGVIWWVVWSLTIMPWLLGVGVEWDIPFIQSQLPNLVGNVFLFGLVIGLVYAKLKK